MRLRLETAVEKGDLIGQVLLEVGYISPQQLAEARERQTVSRGKRLGEILIELGYLSPARLEKGLALQDMEREVRTRQTAKLGR